MSANT
ncbi:hypothetical protein D039_1264A, partial [Vibrio parahaemolyticus EKP-028]